MAQFRNVSGSDRHLALPDWYAPKFVEAGGIVDVDDDLVYVAPAKEEDRTPDHHVGKYDFNQPGIWEAVSAPKKSDSKGGN